MFIHVPWFRENSPALKYSWLRTRARIILLAFWRDILIKDFHFFYFKRDKVGYDDKFTFVNKVINSLETV